MSDKIVQSLSDLQKGVFYRVSDLQSILKNMQLPHSIYTIRDYETWKCEDYRCGKRHVSKVSTCDKCGSSVRAPLIKSPRTRGGGRGVGHRRYTKKEIQDIVSVFSKRL